MNHTTAAIPSCNVDMISIETARTLDGLFRERVRCSPWAIAYRDYDVSQEIWQDYTWEEMAAAVRLWQTSLSRENLSPGDRVAIMVRNCPQWVMFEQAALGLGLVVVPLYIEDRAENAVWCLDNAGASLLLLENMVRWDALSGVAEQLQQLKRIVIMNATSEDVRQTGDQRAIALQDWLPEEPGDIPAIENQPHSLATIIYTSGTTGRPKGVMLSHHNILSNAHGCAQVVTVTPDDILLSFLPLSHTFERTAGYYTPMLCGAAIAYARSVRQLQEDLLIIRPTILISVPRVYEKIYVGIQEKLAAGPAIARMLFKLAVEVGYSRFEYQQKRTGWRISHLLWPLLDRLVARKIMEKLGGRLWQVMSGGAALSPEVSRVFIGLGLPVLQGYGLTETSPVVCANRLDDNVPASVGKPVPGVEVKLGEQNALLIRGPNIMLGYWDNPEATRAILSVDGWLDSGDTAQIDEQGRITITGRLKDIIVTSTGEKIPPTDMEAAILHDPIFEQVMVVGEGRSYLSALVVLSKYGWEAVATHCNAKNDPRALICDEYAEEIILEKIARQISEFPGYAKIHRALLIAEPWTIDNEMLTPTLKLKRKKIYEHYQTEIDKLYVSRQANPNNLFRS
ncbi:long-chain fatty acid--CoA ligase [Nitrosomonas sp. HPC101]|uniref:AMP-dependent synthetase/ligase n=1 Tax=Nitrosomonas sp. HPC101 TaxID=1658667 RepID=UPI00136E208E|nr:long-chain fatty acid--CoA ligase [Nitrosomonas sp. HPC101]MXS85996.1 long-chain fatty acid--CoA ligase [Nitrosomonas sp. HPC101]